MIKAIIIIGICIAFPPVGIIIAALVLWEMLMHE